MKSTLNYLAAKTRPFCKPPTPSLRTSNWSFPIINNFKLIFDLFMELSSLEQASCCIATTFGECSSRRWNDGCCGLDPRFCRHLSKRVQYHFLAVFTWNRRTFSYTIFLFRMLTTHLITGYLSRERTNKHQCRCMMLMPQAPQKMTNELRVGHGYLVLQSCPHNLCLQIYLGVFFRNIWLSLYILFFHSFLVK